MRRSLALVVLLFLVGLLAWLRPWSLLPDPGPTPCALTVEAPWQTEDEWLSGEVLRDLAEMTAPVGRTPRVQVSARPDGDALVVTADLDDGHGRRALRLTRFIWSPEDYAPLASALLAARALQATPPSLDERLPAALTDLRAEALADADQAISARLARSLLDAGAHEDAALLLGAFALREAAGSFSDVRRLLCRATAHLALSRALRGGAAPALGGRLAEATLLVLAGRGADAARALDALASQSDPAARAWTRALTLALRQDWRESAGPSLLERIAHHRAQCVALSVPHAVAALPGKQRAGDEILPDWGRAVLQPAPDVGSSHEYLPDALERELDELRRARRHLDLPPLDETQLAQTVNLPATRCVTPRGPRVLGFAAWAAAFQRHAALVVVTSDWFRRHTLGLPRDADLARIALEARLANVALLPLATLRRAKRESDEAPARPDGTTLARVIARAVREPEALSPLLWKALEGTSNAGCQAPVASAFLPRVCPFGTTHDLEHRRFLCGSSGADDARLAALSPEDFEVQDLRLSRDQTLAQSAAGMGSVFGRRGQYDLRAARQMASAVVASDQERLANRGALCELSAQYCTWLGDEHVARGRDAEGAAAFQRALDESLERVSVSHNLGFLARYYDAHGQPARARDVAFAAGAVGSSGGLRTLARWFERHGQTAQAEALYESIRERYDADENVSPPLLGYYYRADRLRHEKAYAGRFDAATKSVFPGGLRAFTQADRARPPRRGLKLQHEGWRTLYREGLRANDVIVAVDGWRVEDLDQWNVVLELDDAPEVRFVAWRHDRYLDFALRLANRSFEVRLRPYVARS